MNTIKSDIRYFTQKVKDNPDDSFAHARLAKVYWNQGQIKLAEKHAFIAMEISPMVPDPYWILAAIWMFRGEDKEKAYLMAEKGYRLSPDLIEAIVIYAKACIGTNLTRQGIDLLEGAVKQEPENWWARINLFYAYKEAKDDAKAMNEIRKVVGIHPSLFTVNLWIQNFFTTKTGKIVYALIGIIYTLSIISAILFRFPGLMMIPIVWHSQLIIAGMIQIRANNKKGWKGLIIGALLEILYLLIIWWIV
jgi:tetratricopeptide (TPR) repeat protein